MTGPAEFAQLEAEIEKESKENKARAEPIMKKMKLAYHEKDRKRIDGPMSLG